MKLIETVQNRKNKLSIIIPCYNEENTLIECVENVRSIADSNLALEIIIVDDASSDCSAKIGRELSETYPEVILIEHEMNRGKGASIRSGVKKANGDFIAIQDADLEYDPQDLKNLLVPILNNKADVVIGSRFLTVGPHRVLYFWHSMGNKLLTFLSNLFSDLNLTDMEAGYKIFKSEVIKKINIEEDRFGFEPEIIAKISHMNLRIYEMGVSYFGRTYEEGKKINYKDGIRALYCIFKYNAYFAPRPTKILIYLLIALIAISADVLLFIRFNSFGLNIYVAAATAFAVSALLSYPFIFFNLLGKQKKILKSYTEFSIFGVIVAASGLIDLQLTKLFSDLNFTIILSKIYSICIILLFNFLARKIWISSGSKKKIYKPKTQF